MAGNKVVSINLNQLLWDNDIRLGSAGDPPSGDLPSVKPFIWVVFFKVDGTTVTVNETGHLSGLNGGPLAGVVVSAPGSHGDIGFKSMTVGDVRAIPAAIGSWQQEVIPIPVAPDITAVTGQTTFPATFGVAAVLMNDGGHVPKHAIEAGHGELIISVGKAISSLLALIGPDKTSITTQDIINATANVSSDVNNAVINAMNGWQQLWAATGADSEIGQIILSWTPDDVTDLGGHLAIVTPNTSAPLPDDEVSGVFLHNLDIWSVQGTVDCFDPCPANAVNDILGALLGGASGAKPRPRPSPLRRMRELRDAGLFEDFPGLLQWWSLGRREMPAMVALLYRERAFRDRVEAVFNGVDHALADLDAKIDPSLLEELHEGLMLATARSPSQTARLARRVHALLLELESPACTQVFRHLSLHAPNRAVAAPRARLP